MANQINRTKVRRHLQSMFAYAEMKLADLSIYPEIDQARAVMLSRNHVMYEVWLHITPAGNMEVYSEDLLVPMHKKEEFMNVPV